MKSCTYAGCDQPKATGQGQRYCEIHRKISGEARAARNIAHLRGWAAENPERVRERRRLNSKKPASKAKKNARRRQWRTENPWQAWSQYMYEHHGITGTQYEQMLTDQDGACAICRRPAAQIQRRRLHVDHDHACCPGNRSCGQCVRGLLCADCNRLLGWVESNQSEISQYLNRGFRTCR